MPGPCRFLSVLSSFQHIYNIETHSTELLIQNIGIERRPSVSFFPTFLFFLLWHYKYGPVSFAIYALLTSPFIHAQGTWTFFHWGIKLHLVICVCPCVPHSIGLVTFCTMVFLCLNTPQDAKLAENIRTFDNWRYVFLSFFFHFLISTYLFTPCVYELHCALAGNLFHYLLICFLPFTRLLSVTLKK